MSLILNTPPTVEPLSLAEAKTHLRITHADDDVHVQHLITAARRVIEQHAGLCLVTQGWSWFADCWPEHGVVALPLSPVTGIVDVLVHGDDDAFATLDPAHYVVDAASRPARVALRQGRPRPMAGRRLNGIEVRFTAGFGATAEDVPQDLKQALLLTLAHWFDHRGEAEGAALPLSALDIINRHRPVRIA